MEARTIDHVQVLTDVIELLRSNELPYQDLDLTNSQFVSYHDKEGKMIGAGGLEFYSSYALLRSLVVKKNYRGSSVGTEIVNDLIKRAKNKPVEQIYLLTETAREFFLKRGFRDVLRENVPVEIKQSTEFASVCPVSAACMVYKI
jgi:amino-acid N-acetyltransferase